MTEAQLKVMGLVADLRRVTKWGRMSAYASANGLPVTRTWDPFLAGLLESNTTDATLNKVTAKLQEFYMAQLLAGDRVVTFFEPHPDFKGRIYDLARKAVAPVSPVSKSFPSLIPEARVKSDVPGVPTFAGSVKHPDGRIALFFLSGRYVEERDKYKRDEVSAAVRDAFQDYDEFIAIKLRFKQCMDSIVVSPDCSVQIRLDLPTLTNMDYAEICAKTLLQHFHAHFSGPKGEPILGERQNLFRAIDKIYQKKGLGRVSELGFETPTDSVKVEKMRDKTSDLREELYHKAGKAGLGGLAEIVPYRLAVRFPSTVHGAMVELMLPGSFRELAKPSQRLEVAAISGCISEVDFENAVQTLLGHV
ncbi:hypothetical protein J8I87_03005 [Paraburkholderia sp. LEh10]|uniref:hypothetical protein n=1 Tax=Paraburkholderia sp. LEh10 TaxID=2821353 RepID=UPI001AE68309|nr:hypothetical protein [Paraburkholderia sp. LEh10]MBP0588701.1 hypothetical protein [Paraburkholderia sp. LEh10]